MTERLKAALRRGRLDLARRPLARAHRDRQPRRAHQGQVTWSGSPPTPRSSPAALADGERLRRPGPRAGRRRRRRRRGDLRADHRRRARRLRRLRAGRTTRDADRRPGLDRGRPRPRPRHRRRPSPRPRSSGGAVDRPTCCIKIPATDEGCPAITRRHRRGHQRQRHADLQPRPLPRGDGRLPRRPRAGPDAGHRPVARSTRSRRSSSPASTPRSTSGSTRSAPTRPPALRGKAGRRQRPAGLRGVRGGLRAATAARRSRPRAPTRSARCGPRPASRTRPTPTRCTSPTSSSPTPSTRCPRRRMEAFADHGEVEGDRVTGRARRRRAGLRRPRRRRHRLRRRARRARARGRRQVREVVGRAGRDRRGPDGEGRVSHADDERRLEHRRRRRSGRRRRYELFFGYPDEAAFAAQVEQLVADRVASRMAAQDQTLWGDGRRGGVRKRLAWVALSETSRPLVAEIAALRAELREQGLTQRRALRHGRLVAGARGHLRSGRRRARRPRLLRPRLRAHRARGPAWPRPSSSSPASPAAPSRPTASAAPSRRPSPTPASTRAERIVVVTDPGSPLDKSAREAGYRVFLADPTVGGRYSALTAFGLVPSGLAGADIGALLDEAEAIRPTLEADAVDNPGLRLGALLGRGQPRRRRQAGARRNADAPYAGFGDWAEQLIAESTGKDGKGILPVVVEAATRPELRARAPPDEVLGDARRRTSSSTTSGRVRAAACRVDAPLGRPDAAVGVRHRGGRAGCIGINPFDQPDVESAKKAARGDARRRRRPARPRRSSTAPVTVYASAGLAARRRRDGRATPSPRCSTSSTPSTATSPCRPTSTGTATPSSADVRATLAGRRTGRPVTFGWGRGSCTRPGSTTRADRRPASTCRSPASPSADLAVPDRPFTFHEFLTAQAVGDGQVLAEHGRPVLRLHLERPGATCDAVRQAAAREPRSSDPLGQPAARPARTGGCPASPGPAAWCSSASPATCPARR